MLLGYFFYFLFLEFGSFWISTENGILNITSFHKNHRFIIICYPGAALMAGLGLERLYSNIRGRSGANKAAILVGAALAIIAYGSFRPTADYRAELGKSMRDLRNAASFVKQYIPTPATIFVEPSLRGTYRALLADSRYTVWQIYPGTAQQTICGGTAILGGLHGLGGQQPQKGDHVPNWLAPIWDQSQPAPADWVLEGLLPATLRNFAHPIRIYRLPKCDKSTG